MPGGKRKIERVLLVYPPVINAKFTNNVCELPLGIASLAGWLGEQVEVGVLDCALEGYKQIIDLGEGLIRFGLSNSEIISRILEFEPDLVGFSCLFSSQFSIIRQLVKDLKNQAPEILTVCGGTHPSFLPESCLLSTELDFIVLGEGEQALSGLIQALNQGNNLKEIPSLAFKEEGKVWVHPQRSYLENLDQLPFPARHLFPVEKYFKINIPMQSLSRSSRNLAVATSRGCPYRCQFCSSTIHWGGRYRARSPENVISELKELKERYNLEEVKFEDDNLTARKGRARKIFQGMIEERLNLKWNTPNGIAVWTLDEEMLELMKESGCYELTVAVESGDDEVLKKIVKKPVDLERTREMVKVIKKLGIETSGYFIIGFPGETREQIYHTIEYARSLELDRCYIFIFTPLPGTPLAEQARRMGALGSDYDFENANNYYLPRLHLAEPFAEELFKIHRRAFWSINLAFLYRHPFRFVRKYWRSLRSHPEYLVKFFRSLTS